MTADHVILCLNSGSSSLKFALYRLDDTTEMLLADGAVEAIALRDGRLWVRGADKGVLTEARSDFPDHQTAVQATFAILDQLHLPSPAAVGHRLVHGADHTTPECVTPQLMTLLRQLIAFAPLHLPSEIQGIEAVTARFPGLPQLACFHTAFHPPMPAL